MPVRSERVRRERRGARVLCADAATPARERERAGGYEARKRERRRPRSRCALAFLTIMIAFPLTRTYYEYFLMVTAENLRK